MQRNGQNLGILKAKLARSAVGLDMRCQRRRKVMNDSKVYKSPELGNEIAVYIDR